MTVEDRSDDIPARLIRLTREFEEFRNEMRARMPGATQGGAISIKDANGHTRVVLGKLDTAGTHYGVRVPSTGTYDAFYVDERGMDIPQMPLPQNFVPTGAAPYVTIPSGAGWSLVSRTIVPIVSHAAVRVFVGWGFSDGTTTGQFRVLARQATVGVLATTTGPGLIAASLGTAYVNWLHTLPVGVDGGTVFYYFDVEGQVTGGAGALRGYQPSITLMNDSHAATAGGAWGTF